MFRPATLQHPVQRQDAKSAKSLDALPAVDHHAYRAAIVLGALGAEPGPRNGTAFSRVTSTREAALPLIKPDAASAKDSRTMPIKKQPVLCTLSNRPDAALQPAFIDRQVSHISQG